MVGLLCLYAALHSPLRGVIAGLLGMQSRGCFLCVEPLTTAGILASLSAIWLVVVAGLASWSLVGEIPVASYERPLVFGLSVFGFIVIPSAAVGEIAERLRASFLRPPAGPFLAAIPAVIALIISLRRGWQPRLPRWNLKRPGNLTAAIALLSGLTLFSFAAVGLMHPATSGDALSYHAPLSVYLWQDGNLGTFLNRAPDIWALAHPGMAELWFGLLRTAGGERLANLGQFPFVLLGMCAVYVFSRRLGLREGAAQLACIAFPLIPMVATQSTMQPNDIVGSSLVMTGVALASAPVLEWSKSRLILLGFGLGLLATTKLALLPAVFAIGLFIVGIFLINGLKDREWRPFAAAILLFGTAFLLTVSPWWVRNWIHYQNPIYPSAIPLIGRGVFLPKMGTIDISFVPSPLAWPLYPLIEPYDDRSGFGALFLIAAVPGFLYALRHARKGPMILFVLTAAIMLVAWWIFTLHEPRFLIGLVGLSFAFIPWALAAVSRPHRRLAGWILLGASVFTVLVTFDQSVLPFARQPNDRAAFYDTVWAVDPYVTSLPENEGILLNTGFAPAIFEYTAFYPLLGPTQSRFVLPIDGEKSTSWIVQEMRDSGVQYAYVAASPAFKSKVNSIYNPTFFELIHQSSVVEGQKISARRALYRPANSDEMEQATQRYLFRLK